MHGLQACCCCCMLHSVFLLSVVKMLKGKVGGHVLNSHGNDIVDHGKSWKNHVIVFLNFCGNPEILMCISEESKTTDPVASSSSAQVSMQT